VAALPCVASRRPSDPPPPVVARGVAAVRRGVATGACGARDRACRPRVPLSNKEYNGSAGVTPTMDAHALLIQLRRSIPEPGAAARGPWEPTRRRRSSSTGTMTDDASAGKESAGALQEVMASWRRTEGVAREGGGRALLAHADGAASAVVVHQHANGEGHCMHHLRHRSEPPATHADFLLFPLIFDGHVDVSTEQAVLHVAARGGAT